MRDVQVCRHKARCRRVIICHSKLYFFFKHLMFIRTVCFSLFRNVKRLEVYLRLYMNFTLFNLFIQSREKPHLSSLFCTSREREKIFVLVGY